eukprot:13286725-Heterocapsa_arctica.AAC.1
MVAHTAASAAMWGPAHTAASAAMRGPKRVRMKRSMNCWTKANMQTAREKLNEFLDHHPQNVWQMLEMLQNGTISKISEAKLRAVAKTHWHGTQ